MKFKFLSLLTMLMMIPLLGFSQKMSNSVLVGTIPTTDSEVSISVYADGSGTLGFNFGIGKAMNLKKDATFEFLSYIRRYEDFVGAVKNGNSGVKFSDFVGGRPFVPNLPYHSKVFVEASTQGSVETCAFAFRLVNFDTGGWGNDRSFIMTTDQVLKLREVMNLAMDKDDEIRSKIGNLRELLEKPL